MRDAIDSILTFIGSSTLTNEEFEALTLPDLYTQLELYTAINALLVSRGDGEVITSRLYSYFVAKGESFTQILNPASEIFIGAVCED